MHRKIIINQTSEVMTQDIITREKAIELRDALAREVENLDSPESDFTKLENIGDKISNAIVAIIEQYGLKQICVPKEIGFKNPLNGFLNPVIVNIDDNIISTTEYDRAIWFNLYNPLNGCGQVLVAIIDAIEYYKKHNIPLSDWGGENIITRSLRQGSGYDVRKTELTPSFQTDFLGADCSVKTVVEIFPFAGKRIITLVNFNDLDNSSKELYQDDDVDQDLFYYNFMIDVECGVLGVAELIKHYGISTGEASVMVEKLIQKLKEEAQANEYRSAKDFIPLFNKLGFYYQFKSHGLYDSNQGFFPVEIDD